MLVRNLQRLATQTSKSFAGTRSFGSYDRDLRRLANALTRDFERSWARSLNPWDFAERRNPYLADSDSYQPVRSTYEKRTIRTDEDGNTIVKTVRKNPGRPWETYVEEYVNDKEQNKRLEASDRSNKEESSTRRKRKEHSQTSLQQSQDQQSITQQQHGEDLWAEFDHDFKELSEGMSSDFERIFGIRDPFSESLSFRPNRMFADPENTSYRIKTIVNNNGNITVKTATKDPGAAWETSVKQFGKENALEGAEKAESIGETSKSHQKLEQKASREGEKTSEASHSEQKHDEKTDQDITDDKTTYRGQTPSH